MKKKDLEHKIKTIDEIIKEFLSDEPPILTTSLKVFQSIQAVIQDNAKAEIIDIKTEPPETKIIISCDASIKKNPGGPASVGVVIEQPHNENPYSFGTGCKATTNNQAEYDAVYFGLVTLSNITNNPGYPIEIRSDSLLVIDQLKGKKACRDEKLDHKRKIILELVEALPTEVEFVWRPRNSTPALKQANYEAQDFLGVPRH